MLTNPKDALTTVKHLPSVIVGKNAMTPHRKDIIVELPPTLVETAFATEGSRHCLEHLAVGLNIDMYPITMSTWDSCRTMLPFTNHQSILAPTTS